MNPTPPRQTLKRSEALATEGSQVDCDLLYTEKAHFAAAERLRRVHLWLGCTATVASAAAAATLLRDIAAATGALALLGAAGAALLTFLKPDQRAEAHLAAGRQLGALRVELRQLTRLDIGHLPDQEIRDRLADVVTRKANVDASAPGTTDRDFQAASKKIKRGDFEDDLPGT
jgi:hypothetical protein